MAHEEREALYERPIGSAMGSCLLAVGLYTGTFETVVRLLRIAVMEHIKQTETVDRQRRLAKLYEASSATAAIKFCAPYLLQASIATNEDIEFLHNARRYRNKLVHQAIDRAFVFPRLADVSEDVSRMVDIAHAIEQWHRSYWSPTPPGIDISFFGVLESCSRVAAELADDHLERLTKPP